MFTDWKGQTQITKQAFGKLAQAHPKMFQVMGALNNASAAEGLDHKTRELIALAVAITTRCESCISLHAKLPSRPEPPTAKSQVLLLPQSKPTPVLLMLMH